MQGDSRDEDGNSGVDRGVSRGERLWVGGGVAGFVSEFSRLRMNETACSLSLSGLELVSVCDCIKTSYLGDVRGS